MEKIKKYEARSNIKRSHSIVIVIFIFYLFAAFVAAFQWRQNIQSFNGNKLEDDDDILCIREMFKELLLKQKMFEHLLTLCLENSTFPYVYVYIKMYLLNSTHIMQFIFSFEHMKNANVC